MKNSAFFKKKMQLLLENKNVNWLFSGQKSNVNSSPLTKCINK